jgi:predicted dehydrogenase
MNPEKRLTLAIAGVGRWGQNLARVFASEPRCELRYVCDTDPNVLARHRRRFGEATLCDSFQRVLADPAVEAVAIASSAVSHFEMARQALQAGKHVYVEKPMSMEFRQAGELATLVGKTGLKFMVGHLLEYHPSVQRLRSMIESGQVGDVYYIYSQRLNLGVVRKDENAWWSLAPHDISVACYLLGTEPESVSAHGQCFLQPGVEDVVFATLNFPDRRLAHIHVSWLDPHKIRKTTIVGTKQMVTFDDMEAADKIRIYDRGAEIKTSVDSFAEAIALRIGDIVIPRVPTDEPLALECRHFIDAVLDGKPIRSDVKDGLRVVAVLEAGQLSLRNNGQPIRLPS